MSEAQHPHTEGAQAGMGQSEPVAAGAAPRDAQAAEPASFDSLAAAAARLAQLRESKGWLIDDVSGRLKVPASKMRALEAGDLSLFPGTTFALGVVRSYAKMLGVDPAPFTQALRREKGEPEPDLSMPAAKGTGLPRGRVSVSLGGAQPHRSWWWGVAAVLVALIALAMWHHGGESPAWLARLRASANGAAANSREPSTMPVSGQAVSDAATGTENMASASEQAANQAANQAQSMTSGGSAPEALGEGTALSGGVDVPVVSQRESVKQPATALSAPVPNASAAEAPAASAPAAEQASSVVEGSQALASAAASAASDTPGTSRVAFTVKQDSWISVRDKSGKPVFSGIVRTGETKEVAGERPFKVVAGNRLGIESITLDGKTVDAAKYGAGNGNVSRFSLQ
ncbi:MAG: cytoskeleton protein RodZ [Paraburkholderia sp.]|nr:cytoskeleton protein RodZ [Paraburkholderia sp.]